MTAIQCPYCDLKFASEADLRQHIAFDHPNRETEESD
jgi:hypothetical protein